MTSFLTALLYLHVKLFYLEKIKIEEYTLALIFKVDVSEEESNLSKRQYFVRVVRLLVVVVDSIELYCIRLYHLCNLGLTNIKIPKSNYK